MSVILPTASQPIASPTQELNAFVVEWDLVWPEGFIPDPGEIKQTVERSLFPVGPWTPVGRNIPGTETRFVDITVDQGHFHKQWYYRVICQRVKR